VFTSEDGSANVFTRELGLKEIRNADGSVARFSPPLRQYEWPLRPGKRWNHTIVIHRSSGAIERTFVEGEVLGLESVITPAGTFSAFRMRVSVGGSVVTEWWYAPEVGTAVKRGKGADAIELVAWGD